jgi:hypothetical protein
MAVLILHMAVLMGALAEAQQIVAFSSCHAGA